MACQSLVSYSRECGKNAKSGVLSDLYIIAFDDLDVIPGTTDVYTISTGLVTAIGTTASGKFVKYQTVKDQLTYKEDFASADNGTYDITQELSFNILGLGSVEAKAAVENLIANPVAALFKGKNGSWYAIGLNGQTILKTVAGTLDTGSNGRVITLAGSDDQFALAVSPSIIATIIE